MVGMGDDAVRVVDTDAAWRMDVGDAARRITADREDTWRPIMIVGTAGTTAGGAIDLLPELADLARREGLCSMWTPPGVAAPSCLRR